MVVFRLEQVVGADFFAKGATRGRKTRRWCRLHSFGRTLVVAVVLFRVCLIVGSTRQGMIASTVQLSG